MSCYGMLCNIALRLLCQIMLCVVVLCYFAVCYAISCYITRGCVVGCSSMIPDAALLDVMLCCAK